MTVFAELDLVARTDDLKKAQDEIRKIGSEGEKAEEKIKRSTTAMRDEFGRFVKRGHEATDAVTGFGVTTDRVTRSASLGFARLASAAGVVAGSIVALFSANVAWQGAQEVQGIINGFRGMGQSAGEAQASLAAVAQIADRTRAPLEATAELYRRISTASAELGANSQQVAQFTENVGMALAASGTSAAQASGALMQLSQAMAGGTVRAEEFNSILEGAFPIAQAAARGIDEAGGSVGRLRQLVVDGKVSSEEFFNAILSQSDAIQEAFGNTVPTVSQAMTDLNNAVALAAAQFDQSIGLSTGLASAILLVSDGVSALGASMPAIISSIEIFGAMVLGLAATQIPALVVALGAKAAALMAGASAAGVATAAVTALNTAIAFLGGPIGIAAGAVTALGAAMFLTRDRAVNLGGASDEMNAVLRNVPGAADGAAGGLGRAGTVAYDAAGKFDDFTGAVGASRTALQLWYDDYMAATQLPPINGPLGVTINPPGTPDSFAEIENFLNPGSGDTASPLAPGRTPRPRAAPNNIDAGYNPASGGGRGGGGVASDGFQDRLDALIQQFEAEQAVVDAWYEEAQAVLADRRAMEILGAEEHAALLQSVEDEHQRQMAEIRMAAWDSQMGEYGSFLGAMAELTAQGGEKMAKISRGFAAAEAFVNTLRAQAQVLADPKLGFFGKLAAYAKIGAAGMGIVNALKGGGSGGGGSVSAESSRAPTAQPEQTQSRFLQIEVNGEGMFAEALRDNVQSIADAISDLSGRGGTTIVVGR